MSAEQEMIATLSAVYHRTPLGQFPTPVTHPAARDFGFANLWVKRDDLSSSVYGGNKVRKLEFLLSASSRPILTFGPLGSHYVYSTARHAATLGRRTAAVLVPQHMTPHHEEIHRRIRQLCRPVVTLQGTPRSAAGVFQLLHSMVSPAETRYEILAPGGSSPRGTLGYVIGALELAAQVRAGELPAPRKVFVPLGTGGTAVGIAIGLALAGLDTETVAVRVVPRTALPEAALWVLGRRTLGMIGKAGIAVPAIGRVRWTVENGFSNRYAVPTVEAQQAVSLGANCGVALETTYSAKTMAALLACAARNRNCNEPYLFWQTFAENEDIS
ncbi:MAG: pyridoxal-phosphate dependent enzyme [Deltaproteobacteria bacterium]|nr:pyridoxal-phosphate dependent enzyme [Deltaproteobacteria bacterium]MBN2670355.1 pyridoxal-phosphate dependent enzyme [Deltaproteobacteria bacterium]